MSCLDHQRERLRPGEVERDHDGVVEAEVGGLLVQPEAAAAQHGRHRLAERALWPLVEDALIVHQTEAQSGGAGRAALAARCPATVTAPTRAVLIE